MSKSTTVNGVHKHILATFVVAGIVCLWAFVIYPRMVLGVDAPTRVTATPGDGEVLVEWTSSFAGIIDTFRIYYNDGRGEQSVDARNGSARSHTVTGLTNDQEYTFEVLAVSEGVEGTRSDPVTATPTEGRADGGGGDESGLPFAFSEDPQVSANATSATITWATNRAATSQVYYGPSEIFSGNTPQYNVVSRVSDHSVTISSLASCVAYWFKVVSYDAEDNVVESMGGEFKTTGCKGESLILAYQATKVTTSAGATVEAKVSGRGIEAAAPANLKSGLSEVGIEAQKLEREKVESVISTPTGKTWLGEAYSLKAFETESAELEDNFDQPVEVSIDYTADEVAGMDPNSLKIYHYTDGIGWEVLSNCVNDTVDRVVTCETSSFSIFALFGTESSGGSSGRTAATTITQPVKVVAEQTTPSVNENPSSLRFSKNLARGQKDPGVKTLQSFLNASGFTVSLSGPGSVGMETDFFGPLTFAALVKFQEAHADKILAPYGLTKGTGFFGEKTRAFINSL